MEIDHPPQRVVSLVPSMTESLFDLGFGKNIVGITDYCIHPKTEVEKITRVGGTKNPRVEDIAVLHPDLVIANQEENSKKSVHQIQDLGIPVWLTFPKTVDEAIADLWQLARLFRDEIAYSKLRMIEKVVEYARLAAFDQPPVRYFCPIWYETNQEGNAWWMTFNQDTYMHDLLSIMGAQNVFADRKRRYPIEADLGLAESDPPGERDIRYPRVNFQEVITAQPEIILLPDEPYPFSENDAIRIKSEYRASTQIDIPILLVDGSFLTWPGTRIAKAVSELAPEFTKLTNEMDGDTLYSSE